MTYREYAKQQRDVTDKQLNEGFYCPSYFELIDMCKGGNGDCEKCWNQEILEINNNVNHPSHYQGKNECIDVMIAMFGVEAVKGFCKCSAFKYRFRGGKKDGNPLEQDIEKAEWYETYLMKLEGMS